uniref:Glyco_transf_41 domain-containing protein n=1 Tax=Haemonchus placei TaxID=6290 RepID=A0A0N4W4T5_HAEPC
LAIDSLQTQRGYFAEQVNRFFNPIFSKVFVDNFIEVGFCVQSRAFAHAHLTPKNRAEIDRIVKPYHGILLLEDVWPSPDANPSVTLLLKHCEPDRSILDMSTASGIPLLQVFLIVRHLLLWARAIVIYPLCNTNVYASATYPKPLRREALHVVANLMWLKSPSSV